MNELTIDWNDVWKQYRSHHRESTHDPEFWNKRASSFSRHASGSDYVRQFIDILKPDPGWSILDVGCAAGTLAVPLSSLVSTITALDPSPVMLSLLEENCRNQGISNIRIVRGRWEDDWDALDIGIHDVAIASRSLITDDLETGILKLEDHARKRVVLSTLVDDGPRDRRIVEAVGREFGVRADYIIVYNLLRQMGRYANVSFTVSREDKVFQDVSDAVQSFRWMIEDMTPHEEGLLTRYFESILIRDPGGWKLPYSRVIRWAVIGWVKE
jgi:SAM-dependent methyltransferase